MFGRFARCLGPPVVLAALGTLFETSGAAAADTPRKEAALSQVPGTGSLMPLRFTTFGDFFYEWSTAARDDFHIGTLELDVSLDLNDTVDVAAGLAYDGARNEFGLGSFTIDCGLLGTGSHFLVQSRFVERSGIVFGKFDVPFGIAYLEYPVSDNRLVTQPRAVLATHGGWSDIGAQVYAQSRHVNVIGYLVNGGGLDAPESTTGLADDAIGGRFGLSPIESLELGVSGAAVETHREVAQALLGADLVARPGSFDFRLEYLDRIEGIGVARHSVSGAYGRALYRYERLFVDARYGFVLDGAHVAAREVVAGLGALVFPKGEVRAVYERDLDLGISTVFVQIVGGSAWQPTGFRR